MFLSCDSSAHNEAFRQAVAVHGAVAPRFFKLRPQLR